MDYVLRLDGRHVSTFPGVYEIDGDDVTLCITSEPSSVRPAGLTPGAGPLVMKFKKVEKK